jgi:hypothetical protein
VDGIFHIFVHIVSGSVSASIIYSICNTYKNNKILQKDFINIIKENNGDEFTAGQIFKSLKDKKYIDKEGQLL